LNIYNFQRFNRISRLFRQPSPSEFFTGLEFYWHKLLKTRQFFGGIFLAFSFGGKRCGSMIPEVRMHIAIARSRTAVAAAVIVGGCSILALAPGCRAAAFTDPAAFAAAAAAAGIPITTDNFSTYPLGDISNGQTLGRFTYTFDPNLSDPTGTQPTIGLDGSNQVLTGAPFGAFVGGNSVTLTFTGGKTLLAFGATFTYAPADEPLLAGLYDLGILDGTGATTIGNPAGLSADGGSFFLGFVGSPGQEFSQISLFSLVDPPNGITGSPFLIPAYEVNELAFGAPEPGSLGLLAAALAIAALPARGRRRFNSTSGG
jgi:hypothetical protein